MSRIFKVLAMFLLIAVILGFKPGSVSAATPLPHTQRWDAISPWASVSGTASLDSIHSASGSASTSLKFTFPSGLGDGRGADKVWLSFTPSLSEIWTQYYFKYSSNFYFHTTDNKQMYWYISGSTLSTNWYISCSSGQKMRMVYQRVPGSGSRSSNTGYNPTIARDTWYKVTTRAVMNTGGLSNGIFQMWINDGLVINSSNVPYLVGTDIGKKASSLAFDPIFGGNTGLVKPATDYLWVSNTIISADPLESSLPSVTVPPPATDEIKVPQIPSSVTIH